MEITSLLFPLGIIPALAILYIIIGKYEGKFKEKYIFLLFIGGIIFGAIIYFVESAAVFSMQYYIDIIIIYSFLFSIVEQLSKFVILNLKIIRDDGLPIYGASFGLGFSSTFAPLFLGKSFELKIENVPLILLPISVILASCAIGILIGAGIKRTKKMKYFSISLFVGMIMWIITIIAPIISIIFSLAVFYYIYNKILPFSMLSRKEIRKLL